MCGGIYYCRRRSRTVVESVKKVNAVGGAVGLVDPNLKRIDSTSSSDTHKIESFSSSGRLSRGERHDISRRQRKFWFENRQNLRRELRR